MQTIQTYLQLWGIPARQLLQVSYLEFLGCQGWRIWFPFRMIITIPINYHEIQYLFLYLYLYLHLYLYLCLCMYIYIYTYIHIYIYICICIHAQENTQNIIIISVGWVETTPTNPTFPTFGWDVPNILQPQGGWWGQRLADWSRPVPSLAGPWLPTISWFSAVQTSLNNERRMWRCF